MAPTAGTDVRQVVDVARYPLDDPDGAGYRAVVDRVRREIADDGCSVIPDFVRPELHETQRAECAAVAPRAYFDVETVNVYNVDVDDSLPPDHPARIPMRRENAFVARDLVPADAIIHRLYADEAFQRFVAACFGLPRVHELGDPLAGLCLNVVRPGTGHPWHFDTNEFAVSLLTQRAEGGGDFEYVPRIRSARDENVDDVRAVLEGRAADRVRRLGLRPGDLQLFQGRYSLHRVSPVTGTRQRHTAIFSYSERPGVVGSPARTRQLFGRLTPEHEAGERPAVRVDKLLD
jgi:hypothetical protein